MISVQRSKPGWKPNFFPTFLCRREKKFIFMNCLDVVFIELKRSAANNNYYYKRNHKTRHPTFYYILYYFISVCSEHLSLDLWIFNTQEMIHKQTNKHVYVFGSSLPPLFCSPFGILWSPFDDKYTS